MAAIKLQALFGDYPITHAFKRGDFASPGVALEFADDEQVHFAFKRAVRDLEFDVCELAIVTFLMAKDRGVPLSLLPAVLVARFQHPYIVYNAANGELGPDDLSGRRIGIRSYTVTTVTWVRGILASDYGVDLGSINWTTFEDAHVAGVDDPPGVERAAAGKTLEGMLLAGEIDAAIVGAPMDHPGIRTLFPDPAAAAETWRAKHSAIQLNHLVAVKNEVVQSHPDAVKDVYRQLLESKSAAGLPAPGSIDLNPFGIDANRRNLEVVIDTVYAQGLIGRRFTVDELFDDAVKY